MMISRQKNLHRLHLKQVIKPTKVLSQGETNYKLLLVRAREAKIDFIEQRC